MRENVRAERPEIEDDSLQMSMGPQVNYPPASTWQYFISSNGSCDSKSLEVNNDRKGHSSIRRGPINSKDIKEICNKQGVGNWKNSNSKQHEILVGHDLELDKFQEKIECHSKSRTDNRVLDGGWQSLVKEKLQSQGTNTTNQINSVKEEIEKSDKSKEYIKEGPDDDSDEVDANQDNKYNTVLDDERAKRSRILKLLPCDTGRDIILVKKDDSTDVIDNRLREETEQRHCKCICEDETSPKLELCLDDKRCSLKVDLPEKDEQDRVSIFVRKKRVPKLEVCPDDERCSLKVDLPEKESDKQELEPRSPVEGEWYRSIQEDSCDLSMLSSCPTKTLDYELDYSVTADSAYFTEKEKIRIDNQSKLRENLLNWLRTQQGKNFLKGIYNDDYQSVHEYVCELLNQPEKGESEKTLSEKENIHEAETESEKKDFTEKGDIEENEKYSMYEHEEKKEEYRGTDSSTRDEHPDVHADVEIADCSEINVARRGEEKMKGDNKTEDCISDSVIPDDVIDGMGTESWLKVLDEDSAIEDVVEVDSLDASCDNKAGDVIDYCVHVAGDMNKSAEQTKKCRNRRRQQRTLKQMMVYQNKLAEIAAEIEDFLQDSRDWLRKASSYCQKMCHMNTHKNNTKANKNRPKSKLNDCDIFLPKTRENRRHIKILQCGQAGRQCSNAGSNSGGSINEGCGDQHKSNKKEKEGEDQNNNHSDENNRKNRGNPNRGNHPTGSDKEGTRLEKLPGTSLQDVRVPQSDYKWYRKRHSDISDEHWEKFLGFIKEQAEICGSPLYDLHPNPVGECLNLCMQLTDDLPDHMLECIVCLSINSLLKHYANCSAPYMSCDLCTQIFTLITCHVNACVQRAQAFGNNKDGLQGSLQVELCHIQLCKKVRQALNNKEISNHLKMLWCHIRKKLSRVIGGTELETENERRVSILGTPSLENIPEDGVATVSTSRPGSRILSRKRSNLANVAEKAETSINASASTIQAILHGEIEVVSSDAVPSGIQEPVEATGTVKQDRYSSLPIGPPWEKNSGHQYPSFVDRPTGIKGIGEVVYGSKNQLIVAAKSWDKKKKDYQTDGKLPTHYREEGVILDKYQEILTIDGMRYQKDFQWVREGALGNGMSGKCSLATDFQTDEKFCVKEIHIASYEMEEIILWTDLDHPYIVQLYGAIRFGERVFIFMEYIAGGCLTEAINHQKELGQRLSQATALRYFQQILEVLVHLKSKHILHEDLKGDNILLHKEDKKVSIKVTDFGAARRCEDKVRKGTKPIGTQTQWSPEKAEATGYSYPAELWASVCVLVHMLSGTPPWIRRFGSFKTLIVVIVDHSPPLEDVPRNISESVRDLIERGFTVCPGTRPKPEDLLRHHAFTIIASSPTSEAYSILGPGLMSVPCIEDDLTKDLREIYHKLGATSPDRKLSPFIQPSTSVQVYTAGTPELGTSNVHNVGGAGSQEGGACGGEGGDYTRVGGVNSEGLPPPGDMTGYSNTRPIAAGGAQALDFGSLGQGKYARRREGRVEDGRLFGGGSEGQNSMGRYLTPTDPSNNIDPTPHFTNFLNDTTPPGYVCEPSDHVIEYNPDPVHISSVEEAGQSDDNNMRISSDEALKNILPNFDLLDIGEKVQEDEGNDADSETEEEDIFKDFDLKTALIKMNLSSDDLKLGGSENKHNVDDGDNNDENYNDNTADDAADDDAADDDAAAAADDDDDDVQQSGSTSEATPVEPIVHQPQEAPEAPLNSFNDDDLFKSGSPTSAGYFDFNVNSQVNTRQPTVTSRSDMVQSPPSLQPGTHYGQQGNHGLSTPPQLYHPPGQQSMAAFQQNPRNCSFKQAAVTRFLLKSDDMSPHPQGHHQYQGQGQQGGQGHYAGDQLYVQTSNIYGRGDQVSPRHSTINPYMNNQPSTLDNMARPPLSLSPIQPTVYQQTRAEQRYPHSLSPGQSNHGYPPTKASQGYPHSLSPSQNNQGYPQNQASQGYPLSLSPAQGDRQYPQTRGDKQNPHSLSPGQLYETQHRQSGAGPHTYMSDQNTAYTPHNRPTQSSHSQYSTTYQRQQQIQAPQLDDHHRLQPYTSPPNYPPYTQTHGASTHVVPSTAHPQMNVLSNPPSVYEHTRVGAPYSHQNPHNRMQYLPYELIITSPHNPPGVRQQHLQIDVEKANQGPPLTPSTYAQTAPVVSPPKTSPEYKRAISHIPKTHQRLSLSSASASSKGMTPQSQQEEQERAFLQLQNTARDELSQHDGSIHDFEEEDDIPVTGEIDVTGDLTSHEWESMAAYLPEDKEDSRISVTFVTRKDGLDSKSIKMKFQQKYRTSTWESIIDEDLGRHHELTSEYERFCLRHEDGTILDIYSYLGEKDVVLYIEPATNEDWWCVEKGMIMKS